EPGRSACDSRPDLAESPGAPQEDRVAARVLRSPADCEEQPALVPERAHPALGPPVVRCTCEQIARLIAEHRARVRPQVLDPILGKPALHLRKGVAVL